MASGRVPDPPHNADKARGRGGRLVSKRPHSRSPGHDPPNPASPSTTGPSAERAREQEQQGAYAVGFSLGGGLALCQHADRTIIYLYGLTLRHQHASADNPCGVVYPHAPASVMSGRGRPSPGCVRVLGMGVWAGHPKTHTLSYRTRARRTRISVIQATAPASWPARSGIGRACRWKRLGPPRRRRRAGTRGGAPPGRRGGHANMHANRYRDPVIRVPLIR